MGEQGEKYYILKSGKCQVIVSKGERKTSGKKEEKSVSSGSDDREKGGTTRKQLLEGDGFGEISLLYNEKRSATI